MAATETVASSEDVPAQDESKMGFHALQEKKAAEAKAKRTEALKKLSKVTHPCCRCSCLRRRVMPTLQAFKKTDEPKPIDENKLLQQILEAAQRQVRTSVAVGAFLARAEPSPGPQDAATVINKAKIALGDEEVLLHITGPMG